MAKAKKKAPKKETPVVETPKAAPKVAHFCETHCPKDLSPEGFAKYILSNSHMFEGGVGPEIKLAKEYLDSK